MLTAYDRHLFVEGTHARAYQRLGAHFAEHDGVRGVHFAVWAPNAHAVSVVGDFNGWDSVADPMGLDEESGIWDCFVPRVAAGALYKYRLTTPHGPVDKADPYGFGAELRPMTASVVTDLASFQWSDTEWMRARAERQALDAPLAIYEVHLGSWRRGPGGRHLTYAELAEQLADYAVAMGYTHVELLPIAEHPFDGSWGYQTLGYFAPTSRFGTPADFMAFVDHCHQRGLGVILDWVPAHFPRDAAGLRQFDGTALYEHEDPRQGEHPEWGTLVFNYGRNEVRSFLLSNALFWLDMYHVDGLRVDAVTSMLYLDYARAEGQWVPNRHGGRENLEAVAFLRQLNTVVHAEHPGVLTIAEESTAWPQVSRPVYTAGLGFSMKWNMGWMHDTLHYMQHDPIFRRYSHGELIFSLQYAFGENYLLALSHDEVVHLKRSLLSKMPGDVWQQFANLRALYGFMYGHPGKKLLFMGGEFGVWGEWDHDGELDWALLDWPSHQGLRRYVQDLNRLYRAEPACHEVDFDPQGFAWIDCRDSDNSVIAFLRRAHGGAEPLIFVCNFTPLPHFGYRIGVPEGGYYRELLNSDAGLYWGSNLGNAGGLWAEPSSSHARPASLRLTLPPLSTLVLKRSHLPESQSDSS